jgi:hypothetical protein
MTFYQFYDPYGFWMRGAYDGVSVVLVEGMGLVSEGEEPTFSVFRKPG